jgi:adenosylcobinamide-GDP ribazoletransferase
MFPFVGVAIGGAAAIVMLICYRLGLNELTCALIGLAVMAILTGALHEDGLSDFVDGLGGGRTREERLAIMQDSRIGTFATLAIVFSVGMRASLLSQLPSPAHAAGALIAAAAISRAMLPAMMRWLPPARTEGLAFSAGVPDPAQVTVALVLALIVALVCLDFTTAAAAMAGAAVGAGIVAAIAQQKLGGQTGDALGAAQQAAEIVVLVAVAATL